MQYNITENVSVRKDHPMAYNSTTNVADYPTLSSLLSKTAYNGQDSLAKYCYRYINSHLIEYITDQGKIEGNVRTRSGDSKEERKRKMTNQLVYNVYTRTLDLAAELRRQMACFIIDHNLQGKEIDWPETKIRIDTVELEHLSGVEADLDEYFEKRYYVDLLNLSHEVVDKPTPLEKKVAKDEADLKMLKQEKGSFIGHIVGWLLVLLLGLNIAAAITHEFFGIDLRTKLGVLEQVIISGNIISRFGRQTIFYWVGLIVAGIVFLAMLFSRISSVSDGIRNNPTRNRKMKVLKEEIQSIRSSDAYRAETERKKAILAVYPGMIKGLKASAGVR